jgi:hypothetical protein
MAEFINLLSYIYLIVFLIIPSASITIVSFIFWGNHKIIACDDLTSLNSNERGFMTLNEWIPMNGSMSISYTLIGIYFLIDSIKRTYFSTKKHEHFGCNLLIISIAIHLVMIPINITGAILLFKYSTACAYSNTWLLTLSSLIIQWIDMGCLCIILILKSTTLCKKADAHIELA